MSTQLRASSSYFSDSSSTHSWKHDVFLSFRGEDTRNNFTDHLHHYLVQKGINTFIDDNLVRGEEISQALLQAIEGSKISIIVFSENYASSKWCLDELVHILECKRSKQHLVWPVFYKVDPSDIRNHKGTFGKALANHECRFKDKVLTWRTALTEAANLSGSTFKDDGCSEANFIRGIVVDILAQVNKRNHLNVAKYPTGIHSRVKHMLEILDIGGSDDTCMVGIWGTGGIGKTTIAKAVYNSIAHEFEESVFLPNIREDSMPHGGLLNLQNIILSKLIRGNELKATNVDEGITLLIGRLRHKRILLILDDVNQLDQLNKLAGGTDWFGWGSRIIITTRDKHLLISHQVNSIYKASELSQEEAHTLFHSHAFKDNRNLDDGEKLVVDTVVKYARGLPLALLVLGSHLCGRHIRHWLAVLDGYRTVPNPSIHQFLKISYDGLEETEREVFLDIAFFFKGRNTNNVIAVLEGCGRINPEHCIEILKEKALVDIDYYGNIHMHDLIADMGKEIVRQESPKEPGERSRLWCEKDVRHVLTKDTGTEKIEGIIVTLSTTDEIYLSPTCFKRMKNLKIFINSSARFRGRVDHLPEELRILDWHQCPLKILPSNFNMKNLVELNMSGSRISRFGKEFKSLPSLTFLYLRECKYLVKLPDLSGSPNLGTLSLTGCTRLVEVHPSVGFLEKLEELYLHGCTRLEMLPDLSGSPNLRTLSLSRCTTLVEVHPSVGFLEKLEELYLNGCTRLEMLPDLSGSPNLRTLSLSDCTRLVEVHPSVGFLEKLEGLYLYGCTRLEMLPDLSGSPNLWTLPLSGCTKLVEVHPSVGFLEKLEELYLDGCTRLEMLPDLSGSTNLRTLSLHKCTRLVEVHPSVGFLEKLEGLYLYGCTRLEMLPSKVNWTSMQNLDLTNCERLENFPEIMGEMKHITSLDLVGTPIKEFPSTIGFMINLESLHMSCPLTRTPRILKNDFNSSSLCPKISSCRNKASQDNSLPLPGLRDLKAWKSPDNPLDFLTSLGCASTLHKLDLSESTIAVLHKCISKFVNLSELDLSYCESLVEIPKLPPGIVVLDVTGCSKLGRISKLSNILKRKESQMIKNMDLTNCFVLCENLIQELQRKSLLANDDDVEDLFSLFLSSQQYGFEIICPGSEVPKWFSCQMDFINGNRRFECDIEIFPHFKWENTGLALCGAADEMSTLKFEICISGELVSYKMENDVLFGACNNLWVRYVPFPDMWQSSHTSILPPSICQVTIEQVSSRSPGHIKSCGVHLVMPPNEDICMKLSSTGNRRSNISDDISKWTKEFRDYHGKATYKVSISGEDLKDECSISELQYSRDKAC